MPDEKPSQPVEKQPPAESGPVPLPVDNAKSTNATEVREQKDETRITSLEERMGRAEKIMAWLTGAIALFALGSVIVGVLQWNVMSGQLDEMKREEEPYIAPDGKRLPVQNFCFVYSPRPERPINMPTPFDICEVR